MKAITHSHYGTPDVLELHQVAVPTIKANDLLIRVYATPVNFGDIMVRNFGNVTPRQFNMPFLFWFLTRLQFGIFRPHRRILGSDFAGEVVTTGKNVTRFNKGDHVFGYRGAKFGACAEYMRIPESGCLALKPTNTTWIEAASIPYGSITALNLLRKVNIQAGQRVLVIGASGAIGSAAVQLARFHFGAIVDGVCSSAGVELVKSLGAEKVIDYNNSDFTKSGQIYDVIFDVLGKSSYKDSKNSLSKNGKYLFASFKSKQLLQMLWTRYTSAQKVICSISLESAEDLQFIRELVEEGKIKAFVDRSYPIDQAADAHRYVESGLKKGSVTITIDHPFKPAESFRT